MMRSSGGKRLNQPKKILCCNVRFLDDAVATYEIPKDAKGSVLFQSVIRSLELDTKIYFGLLFLDQDNYKIWLDLDKKVKSQLKSDVTSYHFEFRVKYYVTEPGAMLLEELTRYQFVLQLKQDLFHQRLSCTFRTLALLASFIVQSELGDYDPGTHKPGYLSEFKFVPNQPPDLEIEIAELHKLHSGLSPEQVELRYLEKAKWLTSYGVDKREVRDSHGLDMKLGIAPAGILLYQGDSVITTFEWPRVTKLRFHQKKFMIKIQPRESGTKEQEHCFLVNKTKHCKQLWKVCLEHHGFYKSLPPIERTATLLRSTSQKSHGDGTQTRANIRSESFRDTPPHRTPATSPHRAAAPSPHRSQRTAPSPHHPPRQHHAPRQHAPARPPTRHTPTTPRKSYEQKTPNYAAPPRQYESRNDYYNSLPKQRHYNAHADSNRYQDKSVYEKNLHNYYNAPAYNTISSRPKSFGTNDVLDLDYPSKRTYGGVQDRRSENFRNFFTDTVLQNKIQYNSAYGKSWANDVGRYPGSKSSPDVRLAASQPAFITSSAMRHANFLMTTEL